jgi:dolichyl-phosphate beta-glucosyltransferase
MKTPELTLILPAYNERATIGRTIEQYFAYFERRGTQCEIIVAADGNDGTRELVRQMIAGNPRLKVIGHEERRGKGRGVREAVAIASGAIIGYADADNKVPIEEFEKVGPWLTQGYHVVTGSRALAKSSIERKQSWYRRIGSRGFHVFMQTVVGLPGIHDTQCGFKFFTREAAVRLFHSQVIDGYMFDVEILALAQHFGYTIKEVPIRWRDDGDSRLNLISGNLRNIKDIFRIRLSRARLRSASPALMKAHTATEDE